MFLGGFVFAIGTDTTDKVYILGFFVSFPLKIFRFILGIDVGVFLKDLVHALEGGMAGPDVDEVRILANPHDDSADTAARNRSTGC